MQVMGGEQTAGGSSSRTSEQLPKPSARVSLARRKQGRDPKTSAFVGDGVGTGVGGRVGSGVGNMVGTGVGWGVGSFDGCDVGSREGVDVGAKTVTTVKLRGEVWFCTVMFRLAKVEVLARAAASAPEEAAVEISASSQSKVEEMRR